MGPSWTTQLEVFLVETVRNLLQQIWCSQPGKPGNCQLLLVVFAIQALSKWDPEKLQEKTDQFWVTIWGNNMQAWFPVDALNQSIETVELVGVPF